MENMEVSNKTWKKEGNPRKNEKRSRKKKEAEINEWRNEWGQRITNIEKISEKR